jgi:Holliday junction resolvasome RuvABC endonuclease subunit
MNPISPIRILAVEPGVEHAGIALLEGENLLWYGVKTFPGGTNLSEVRLAIQQHLASIVERYQPKILAVEEPFYAQSLLSEDLVKLAREIKAWGKIKGLEVRSYTPPVVKAFFCRDQRTKQSLAEAMIEKYPFLKRYFSYLPLRRRYWFHIFDAVALGLMCARKLAREKVSPRKALVQCA